MCPFSPSPPCSCSPPSRSLAPSLSFFLLLLSIAAGGVGGVGLRIWIVKKQEELGFFTSSPYFLCNSLGSGLMGLLVGGVERRKQDQIESSILMKALTVGFCGSFTTLASWIFEILRKCSWGAAIEELLSGLFYPFGSFFIGRDLGRAAPGLLFLPFSPSWDVKASVGLILLIGGGVAVFLLSGIDWKDDVYISLFGSLGAVLRFLVSFFVDPWWPWKERFVLSTFFSNVLAVILDGAVFSSSLSSTLSHDLTDGLGGSLSTVSSFVKDSVALWVLSSSGSPPSPFPLWSYVYTAGTVGVCLGVGAAFWGAADLFC